MAKALEGIGLDWAILFLILLILLIVLIVAFFLERSARLRLEERLDRLCAGSEGESLEDLLVQNLDNYGELEQLLNRNQQSISDIYHRLVGVVQKVGIVKYDAFHQMGGNLSSAITLLNEKNDGFIINTVQSTDGCYSYVKRVIAGTPDVELGKEEQASFQMALEYGKS